VQWDGGEGVAKTDEEGESATLTELEEELASLADGKTEAEEPSSPSFDERVDASQRCPKQKRRKR
jgi:hypothetical protein